MLLLLSSSFSIILFLFGMYLSMKNPKLLLKTKSLFNTAFFVSFFINISFLAGYQNAQTDLIENGFLSIQNSIAFDYKYLSGVPAILYFIHSSFIINFAKGKKEGTKKLQEASN